MNGMNLTEEIRKLAISGMLPWFHNQEEADFLKMLLEKPVVSQERRDEIPPQQKTNVPVKPVTYANIADRIRNCTLCSDVEGKKEPVGNGRNGVMIIMNAPRSLSNIEKKLFKTDSVDLLKKMLSSIAVELADCYVTNLLKCEPKESFSAPSHLYKNCDPIIREEISQLKPQMIIVMGDMQPLQRLAREQKDFAWFNIDHPVTILKNPDLKKRAWETLKVIKSRLAENAQGH